MTQLSAPVPVRLHQGKSDLSGIRVVGTKVRHTGPPTTQAVTMQCSREDPKNPSPGI